MKKIISLLLASAIVLSSAFCVSAGELGECTAKFSIAPIKHQMTPVGGKHKPLEITIQVPSVHSDGLLLVAFYTDGKMTKLIPCDISETTSPDTIKFEMTSEEGDGYPRTPDEIKLFTWRSNNLKPLTTASGNMLTPEVVESANSVMLERIIKPIVSEDETCDESDGVNIVNFLCGDGDSPGIINSEFDKIHSLFKKMGECAQDAYDKRKTQLFTSEYAKTAYYDDIVDALEAIKNDSDQKAELQALYNNILPGHTDPRGPRAKQTIDYLLNLLCIDVKEFISAS